MHHLIPDFRLKSCGPVSEAFIEKGILSFKEAMHFVKQLPYHRNADKNDSLIVLKELCGTCSTKHAVIKRLADEQGVEHTELVLGIFMMNGEFSSKVSDVLQRYHLEAIPEAHNYLKYRGHIIDLTFDSEESEHFSEQLVSEIIISPEQILDFKVHFHQEFLKKWLSEHEEIPYRYVDLWNIREQCIQSLAS